MRIGNVSVGKGGEEARSQEALTTDTIVDLYHLSALYLDKNPEEFNLTLEVKTLPHKNQKPATAGMNGGAREWGG